MNEWYNAGFSPQGWQCPICKRVYSPMTSMCYYCGNVVPNTVPSTTLGETAIDWAHHESVTKAEKPKEG